MTKSAAPANRVLIRASAGTGKTFRLSNHYLSQLLRGASPETILATTFTRKAAGEIQERLFERLLEAATSLEKANELAGFLGLSLTSDQAAEQLHLLARNMHRVRVSTLDAFYAKLATAYSLEFGLPSDWHVLDEVDVLPLKLRALDDTLKGAETQDTVALLHLLDKGESKRRVIGQMLDAVNSFHNVFVDAGRRYEPWDQIPEPQFASDEALAEAIIALQAEGQAFPHKMGAKAIQTVVGSLVAEQWKDVINSTMVKYAIDGTCKYQRKPFSDALTAALKTVGNHAAQHLLVELRAQNRATFELLHRFDLAYQDRKGESRGLTFTDVTRYLADSISSMKHADVGFRLDGEIDHLLLDEFQDTSLPQWGILEPIAEQTLKHTNGSVFCVGDTKQAIYRWRGGVAAIFDRVEDQLGIKPETMDCSYRSAKVIIDVVNELFGDLPRYGDFAEPDRLAAETWHSQFKSHKAAPVHAGYAEVRVTPKSETRSTFGSDLRKWAAEFVRDLHHDHPGRTIGVLTRKNEVASEIVAHLRGLGVNASDEGREKLTDSAAVQLLLSLITLADTPHDKAARFHVATSPLTLPAELSSHLDDVSAAALSTRLRSCFMDEGFGVTVHRWASYLVDECGPRDIARLRQLVALADCYDRTSSPTASEFLRLVRENKANDPLPELVRVMTVHQSKGLEFDIVVLTELDDPCYNLSRTGFAAARPKPHEPPDRIMRYRAKEEVALFPREVQEVFREAATAEMTEALCRFYVAATRAQSSLYFLVAPSGKSRSSESTRFSDLVRVFLCDNSPFVEGEVAATFGDPDWDGQAVEQTAPREPHEATIALRSDARERLQPVTPSSLAHGAGLSREWTFEGTSDGSAAARGTLVHAWLEQIEWLDTSTSLSVDRQDMIAHRLDIAPSLVQSACDLLETFMGTDTARTVLSKQLYEETTGQRVHSVLCELPFTYKMEGSRVTGTVDRLVLFEVDGQIAGGEIIDWKTDWVRDDSHLAEKVNHYRPQLAAYAQAIAELFSLDVESLSTRLVFLACGRDVQIDVSQTRPAANSVPGATQQTLFD